jgi:hypothetical protein
VPVFGHFEIEKRRGQPTLQLAGACPAFGATPARAAQAIYRNDNFAGQTLRPVIGQMLGG